MGILKDWKEDTDGYTLRYKVMSFLSSKNWIKLHKWRKQRADRGWSDRDTWGAGEHIMEMMSGMLRYLDREQNPIDWDAYFKTNYAKPNGYTSLTEVANDLDQYIEFCKTTWTDYLDIEMPGHEIVDGEYKSLATPAEYKKIRAAIKKFNVEEKKSAAKATKAIKFVADNHRGLWW